MFLSGAAQDGCFTDDSAMDPGQKGQFHKVTPFAKGI